ncbi:MAG: LacI family DNA-binding transcriptional regulator [Pseudomonadota bacterium]
MSRSATIRDVAERAGCGVATVSRVLNGTGPASATTRDRVLAAAEVLGFEFSEIGRSLQSRRTRTIGCLVPSLVNPVFAEAVQAVQAAVLARGYHLILMCSDYDPGLETDAIRMLVAQQVEGLVLTVSDATASPGLDLVRARGLRHCLVFNAPVGDQAAFYVDNAAAAEAVAAALWAEGHVHTGFLALRFAASDRSRQRYEGFARAAARLGMAPPALLEIDEQQQDLAARLADLLAGNARLSGLFASNDLLALAAMRTVRDLGRRVPEDLSIVGFDGIPVGDLVEPTLATIATDPRRMGGEAAAALLDAIEHETSPAGLTQGQPIRFRPGRSLGPAGGDHDGRGVAAPPPPPHRPPSHV